MSDPFRFRPTYNEKNWKYYKKWYGMTKEEYPFFVEECRRYEYHSSEITKINAGPLEKEAGNSCMIFWRLLATVVAIFQICKTFYLLSPPPMQAFLADKFLIILLIVIFIFIASRLAGMDLFWFIFFM